jgi:hypothetical protein
MSELFHLNYLLKCNSTRVVKGFSEGERKRDLHFRILSKLLYCICYEELYLPNCPMLKSAIFKDSSKEKNFKFVAIGLF